MMHGLPNIKYNMCSDWWLNVSSFIEPNVNSQVSEIPLSYTVCFLSLLLSSRPLKKKLIPISTKNNCPTATYVDFEMQTLILNSGSVNSAGYRHSMADYNRHTADTPSWEIFLHVVNVGTPQDDGIYVTRITEIYVFYSDKTIRFIIVRKLTVNWTLSQLRFRRLCFWGRFSVGLGPHFAVGCYGFLVPRIAPLCWMLGMSPLPFILSSHLLSLGVIGASPFCWHFPLDHHHVMFTATAVWWRTVLL